MATTTNYGWTTPDDTALVKDGASAIRTLGSSIDTTTKALNPSTTLGDIEYRSSTANTNTRLAIGTTGQVLTVSGGVPAWSAAPSSVPANDSAYVGAEQTTTSTSYTNLTTSGPAVTLTTGTKALVIVSAMIWNYSNQTTQAYTYLDFAVSGATTRNADDSTALATRQPLVTDTFPEFRIRASSASVVTLTAGSNTFTAKYRVNSGTGNFSERRITVINLA